MNDGRELRRANRSLVAKLLLCVAGSAVFGFALVPLYRVLCKISGIGDQQTLRSPVSGAQRGAARRRRYRTHGYGGIHGQPADRGQLAVPADAE